MIWLPIGLLAVVLAVGGWQWLTRPRTVPAAAPGLLRDRTPQTRDDWYALERRNGRLP